MLISIQDILLSFAFCIIFISLFYVTGYLLHKIFSPSHHQQVEEDIFPHLFRGFCFCISLYAIIVSSGQSILLPVPFLVITWITHSPVSATFIRPMTRLNGWIILSVSIILYWIFFCSLFLPLHHDQVSYVGYDAAYYGRLGDLFNAVKGETSLLVYDNSLHVSPYHYGDLWFTAFVTRISGLQHSLVTVAVVYPVLASMFIMGLASWLEKFHFTRAALLLIVVFAGLFNGFTFLMSSIYTGGYPYAISMVTVPKLFLCGIIIITLMRELNSGTWTKTLVIFSLSACLYTPLVPVIALSLFIIFVAQLINKITTIRQSLTGIICAVFILVWLVVYYLLLKNDTISSGYTNEPFRLNTAFLIFASGAVHYLPILPFIALAIIAIWKKPAFLNAFWRSDTWFLILLPLAGLLFWSALYHRTYEAVQFFSNVFMPFSAIVITTMLLIAFRSVNTWIKIAVIILFASSLLFNLSHDFEKQSLDKTDLETVRNFVEKHGEGAFINLRPEQDFNSVFTTNTSFSQPLIFLDYILPRYENISIDAARFDHMSGLAYRKSTMEANEQTPYVKFIRENFKTGHSDSSIVSFIHAYPISYITVSPGANIPDAVRPLITDSIRITTGNWMIYSTR